MNQEKEEIKKEEEPVKNLLKTRVIKFEKPVTFECETFKELDLSGLDDLNTDDLLTAERIYTKVGGISINPETTLMYSLILAQIASKKPFEFFDQLPPREALKIKKEIYDFFYRTV